MEIIIPKHAKKRIETYNLTEELVKKTVENPEEIVDGYGRRLIAHKRLNDYILRVVYEQRGKDIIVITAYRAEKKRYWGEKHEILL
ncbi:MAG: DUF4258 domain-containing protein [Euryarchaeota archaeon]|nr:DUF4258 domain-containing protein [Euryarchaeota archaeon]